MHKHEPPAILLASASPRRAALLEQIAVPHVQAAVHVDETPHPGEPPRDYVQRLARAKAHAGAAFDRPDAAGLPSLGADTAVVVDGEILGKPRDEAHALEMLAGLSGRTHEVHTAVALVQDRAQYACSVTRVTMRAISAAQRLAYWRTGEGADKAGAYAIQGLGAVFIARIEGSYSGVMGLPLYETAELLTDFSIPCAGLGRAL